MTIGITGMVSPDHWNENGDHVYFRIGIENTSFLHMEDGEYGQMTGHAHFQIRGENPIPSIEAGTNPYFTPGTAFRVALFLQKRVASPG